MEASKKEKDEGEQKMKLPQYIRRHQHMKIKKSKDQNEKSCFIVDDLISQGGGWRIGMQKIRLLWN